MTVTLPTLAPEGRAALDAHLKASADSGILPALFFAVYNADGPVYSACRGDRVLGQPDAGQVNENTTLALFSATKLVTSVACLQLADKGIVDFDDPALLAKHCPELVAVPILEGFAEDGSPVTHPRQKPLTLRHLLTHTSGLAYSFTLPAQLRWEKAVNAPSLAANNPTIETLTTPLHFEPGTKYVYSTGLDWAGVFVSRLTGQSLEEYFDEHIWGPCGVTGMSFYLSNLDEKRHMGLCVRDAQGKLILYPGHGLLQHLKPGDVLSGGGGLMGTAKGYLGFLQHLLRCKDQEGGIISPAAFKLLFTNALPPHDETTAHADLAAFLDTQAYITPALLDGQSVQHSLGLALTSVDSPDGRRAGSGFWGGLAKTRFWVDPDTGIIGFCGTQILDQANPQAFATVMSKMERIIYDNIVPSA